MKTSDKLPVSEVVERLTAELDVALALLKASAYVGKPSVKAAETPASLLDQCLALCAQHEAVPSEPVRTVHHFACTGGTLISKCIAAMPNVQLLSEVDPLSTPINQTKPQFAPSDLVKLLCQSTRGAAEETLIELFTSSLKVIYAESVRAGQRLVLRDHTHSHFCMGPTVPQRPALRDMVRGRLPVLSLVTVRHPVDSYLSLKANGWVHFSPPTFDEYCERYLAFLKAYEGVPIVRYEEFVSSPFDTMRNICSVLDLPFNDEFMHVFSVNRLTGDSGRAGSVIQARPRRKAETLAELAESSSKFVELTKLLKYED